MARRAELESESARVLLGTREFSVSNLRLSFIYHDLQGFYPTPRPPSYLTTEINIKFETKPEDWKYFLSALGESAMLSSDRLKGRFVVTNTDTRMEEFNAGVEVKGRMVDFSYLDSEGDWLEKGQLP